MMWYVVFDVVLIELFWGVVFDILLELWCVVVGLFVVL